MKKRGRITHKLLALVGALRGSGLTWDQVSREVGYVNGPALYQRCRAYGLCEKYAGRPPLEKVQELIAKGYGRKRIAKELNCGHGTVSNICKENNLVTKGDVHYTSSGLAKEVHANRLKEMEIKSLGEIHTLKHRTRAVHTGWSILAHPTPGILRIMELLFQNPCGLTNREIRSMLNLSMNSDNHYTHLLLKELREEGAIRCEVGKANGRPLIWYLTGETRRRHCKECRYRKIQYADHLNAPRLPDSPE